MASPRYSYQAINQLALSDTGHFVFLDSWTISLLDSMLSQERPFYLWMNDQNPLSEPEIDDLDNRLSTAQGQLMRPLVGLIMPICTGDLPEGTLLCDGSIHQRADYPNLYDAIAPGYRLDADSFIVPDMRDRFVLGAGPDHAAGSMGGSFTHTQTEDELAPHAHTTLPHTHTEGIALPAIVTVGLELPTPAAVPGAGITGPADVTVNSAGGGQPMDITPRFIALRYVVVAL